jgi:hypothetical protein
MKFPGRSRIFPIGFGIPEVAARATDDLWFAIAIDVGEGGRFVVNDLQDECQANRRD